MGTQGRTPPPPQVKALNCPGCGGPVTIHGFAHTLTVVCPGCLSVLDAKDPNFAILQRVQIQQRIQPGIPLGTRGKWHGDPFEVIGFQVRTIFADGVAYSWAEYLLFNPYKGFRYLTEYRGHWNDVTVLRMLPGMYQGSRPTASLGGQTYRHFQTAEAQTTYVLGEFPWQVRAGETVKTMDFVAPPMMLSAETTPDEVTWSQGEYIPGKTVWEAFKLPGSPPSPEGVFENQPSPYKTSGKGIWSVCLLLLGCLFALSQLFYIFAAQEKVFRQTYSFFPRAGTEPSFVTSPFELKGRTSDVEVEVRSNLENNWAYLNFALINSDTGEAYDFGREVSYYHGSDSDGSWSEGGRNDDATIPSVPSGHYYLRVEPEMEAGTAGMQYEIIVRRDVPSALFFLLAAGLLIVPPILSSIRSLQFEQRRWSESDYAGGSSSGSGGDDD